MPSNVKEEGRKLKWAARRNIYMFAVLLVTCLFFLAWILTPKDCTPTVYEGEVVKDYAYTVIRHTDVNGEDLMHVQARDMATVRKVCDMFDECAGFNSNGWLKSKVSVHVAGPADLYIKGKPQTKSTTRVSGPDSSQTGPTDYAEMLVKLKVFIYETSVGLNLRTLRSGGYGVEKMFIDELMQSKFRTRNPEEATFFFIPIRCATYISQSPLEDEGKRQAKEYVAEMLDNIQTTYPYWRRSSGADHFYICAHEIGAEIGGDLLKNSIALVNTADYEDPYFIPNKDISLPPNPVHGFNSLPVVGKGGYDIDPKYRTILAFFAGDVTSGRIRPAMWKNFVNDPDFTIIDQEVAHRTYVTYLAQSKFCLVPRGREVWSPRLIDAVFFGCIPVILSDNYHLPLQGIVDWSTFSVIVPEHQILQLKQILLDIPASSVASMQQNLLTVYKHFIWNKPAQMHDAFYSVMYQLWQRRHIVRNHER